MLTNRAIEFVTVAIVFLLLGLLIDNWVIHYFCNNEKFYDVRLFEIIQTSVTVILAVFISYIVSHKVNVDVKRREVIVKIIELYQDRVTEIYKTGVTYLAAPTKDLEKQILSDFKLSNGTLSIIKSMNDFHKDQYASLFTSFVKFKMSLTKHPFGSENPNYDQQFCDIFENRYGQHLNEIQRIKLAVFTVKV